MANNITILIISGCVMIYVAAHEKSILTWNDMLHLMSNDSFSYFKHHIYAEH